MSIIPRLKQKFKPTNNSNMRKHLFSIILIGLSLQGFSQEEAKATKSGQHYTTNKFDCVIFPADFDGTTNDKVFTPSTDQVNIAEKAMETQLKDAPILHPVELKFARKHLTEYKRQYFGYIYHKNHHILYINCFMSDDGDNTDENTTNWLTQEVKTGKTGAYYWQATFDLDEGMFTKVNFAGSGI